MIYNTGETSEELRREYNPEGSSLRKSQLRMVEMLVYLDQVCKDSQIEYVLSSGNIIGAIRHEGQFIPWDDDMDIYVRRCDCRRLEKAILDNPHPQFILQNHTTDPGFFGDWPVLRDLKSEYIQDSKVHNLRKFRGVQIDIFPIEEGISYKIQKICDIISRNTVAKNIGKGHLKAASFFYSLNSKVIYPFILLICSRFKDSYLYSPLGASWCLKYSKSNLFPAKPIKFEGKIFMGPANPENYLKEVYGDYSKLPPKDKRDHHKVVCKIWD